MAGVEVDGRSLGLRAYEQLKSEIIGLGRPPGQRLVERELAAELAISRIPLREALRLLEAEGLVVIVPRQGAMVAPFTVADVRHLFDVRESLEALAARLAALHGDAGALAGLQRHLKAARAANQAGDAGALADANASFHEAVIAMSANPLLQSLMHPLNARVRWLFHLSQGPVDTWMCEEHEALYQAIAAGDAEQASEVAFRHVHATRDSTLAMAARWTIEDLDPVAVTRTRQRDRRA